MNQELAFAKKLEEIRKLAKEQGNMLSQEQVEEAFAEIDISKEQLEPVFAYLKSKNIGIGEPIDMEEVLTQEDKDYLAEYLKTLGIAPEVVSHFTTEPLQILYTPSNRSLSI